jgi:small-conductance mechanosensitive channel
MPAATVRLSLAAFWADNSDVVTAVLSIVLALIAATLLDRYIARRGHNLAAAVTRGEVSPVLDTRLRFFRRLIYAGILLLGVAVAASQFTGISKLAASILASGALAAAIIGFAARQVLANVVPGSCSRSRSRCGSATGSRSRTTTGSSTTCGLNFTVLRTGSDVRVVIPNERLAAGILATTRSTPTRFGLDISVWLPPEADAGRALEVLGDSASHRRGHARRGAHQGHRRSGAAAAEGPAPGGAARGHPEAPA